MKGQYLAVEMTMTILIGLTVLGGTVALMNDYSTSISNTAEDIQHTEINHKLNSGFEILDQVDRGEIDVALPENLGGDNYQVNLGNSLQISKGGTIKQTNLLGTSTHNTDGSANGGKINLIKTGDDNIILNEG